MTTQTVGSHLDEMRSRAVRNANDLEAHRQLERAKVELRDRSVVELIDAGLTIKEVAGLCHIAPSRIHQILARS